VPVFTFDEASHTYTLDGLKLPSVTGILAPIKPDFSMVPPDVLEAKRAFGIAVHTACEWDDDAELDDDCTDAAVMGCVRAWRAFRQATGCEIHANEQRLYHPGLRFAGTLDRFARLKELGNGFWILDIKTSVDPHPSYGVQLSGYRLLLAAQDERGPLSAAMGSIFRGLGVDKISRGTVHLDASGTYRFHQYQNPNDEAAFMACLSLHHWKESQK
jgi:hypothetical protein